MSSFLMLSNFFVISSFSNTLSFKLSSKFFLIISFFLYSWYNCAFFWFSFLDFIVLFNWGSEYSESPASAVSGEGLNGCHLYNSPIKILWLSFISLNDLECSSAFSGVSKQPLIFTPAKLVFSSTKKETQYQFWFSIFSSLRLTTPSNFIGMFWFSTLSSLLLILNISFSLILFNFSIYSFSFSKFSSFFFVKLAICSLTFSMYLDFSTINLSFSSDFSFSFNSTNFLISSFNSFFFISQFSSIFFAIIPYFLFSKSKLFLCTLTKYRCIIVFNKSFKSPLFGNGSNAFQAPISAAKL